MALTKKAKRILLIVLGAVIVIPIVLVLVILLHLGTVVKIGFEKVGPKVLGVSTRLDHASVSLLKSQVTLKGMAIGNPEGYTAPTFIEADLIHVDANISALMRNEIHIQEVTLDGPEFTIEYRKGKSNIKAVMEKLESDEKKKEESEDEKKDEKERKLKIDLVQITNAKVNVMILDQKVEVSLPSVKITNIGHKDGGGISPGKVAHAILGQIQVQIANLPELAQSLGDLREAGSKLGDAIKDEALGVGEEVKDAGGKLLQDAKGLFKKDEE